MRCLVGIGCICALTACSGGDRGGGDELSSSSGIPTTTAGVTSADGDEATGGEEGADEGTTGPKLDAMGDTGAGETTGGECAALGAMAQNQLSPVDIIFAVDTSGSMTEEKNFVQANMNAFSQQIFLANIDDHNVMIAEASPDGPCVGVPLGSGSCPADTNLPDYLHVVDTVGSSNSLDRILATYNIWQTSMRDNAIKHVVVVSDDDSSMDAATFDTMLKALDPSFANYYFHAIVAHDDPDPLQCAVPGTNCCAGLIPLSADIGQVYLDLVALTGGVAGDLCAQEFGPVFDQIAQSVTQTTPLACEWEIPDPPEGTTFDPTKVNVEFNLDGMLESIFFVESEAACGTGDGWYYVPDNTNPEIIRFCPATCTRVQDATEASIEILFGCDTIPVG